MPCFTEGMENETMSSALCLTFGEVCDRNSNQSFSLLILLGSVAHHSDFSIGMIENNHGHILGNARILHGADVLEKLKHLTTVKPSDRMTPTGAPPRMSQLKIIQLTHEDTNKLISNFLERAEKMIDAVRTAIENNNTRSGELNLSTLEASVCTGAFRNALIFHVGKSKRSQ